MCVSGCRRHEFRLITYFGERLSFRDCEERERERERKRKGTIARKFNKNRPVLGADRAVRADGWKRGKLCEPSDYGPAKHGSNATMELQAAIDDCKRLRRRIARVVLFSSIT